MTADRSLTAADVARILGVSRSQAYDFIRSMDHERFGARCVRLKESVFNAWRHRGDERALRGGVPCATVGYHAAIDFDPRHEDGRGSSSRTDALGDVAPDRLHVGAGGRGGGLALLTVAEPATRRAPGMSAGGCRDFLGERPATHDRDVAREDGRPIRTRREGHGARLDGDACEGLRATRHGRRGAAHRTTNECAHGVPAVARSRGTTGASGRGFDGIPAENSGLSGERSHDLRIKRAEFGSLFWLNRSGKGAGVPWLCPASTGEVLQ